MRYEHGINSSQVSFEQTLHSISLYKQSKKYRCMYTLHNKKAILLLASTQQPSNHLQLTPMFYSYTPTHTPKSPRLLQKTQQKWKQFHQNKEVNAPPPSRVPSFSLGKTDTLSSSNLYQSSSSSSIPTAAPPDGGLIFIPPAGPGAATAGAAADLVAWNTLFFTNPI
jgi:hypothetical protein